MYKYGDYVEIVDGFYKSLIGIVIYENQESCGEITYDIEGEISCKDRKRRTVCANNIPEKFIKKIEKEN